MFQTIPEVLRNVMPRRQALVASVRRRMADEGALALRDTLHRYQATSIAHLSDDELREVLMQPSCSSI
jgi:hypothetical protein